MTTILFALLLGLPVTGTVLCAVFRSRRVLETITVAGAGLTFLSALWLVTTVMQVPASPS